MKIIGIPDLKVFLEKTDTVQDALLGRIIDMVSVPIEKFLNRNLTKAAYSQYFDAGRRFYFLPAYPIDENETLTVTLSGVVQTKDSDYFVDASRGLIEFQYETPYTKPKEVKIDWTGGFVESPISEVIGSDTKNYRCILSHISTTDNKPITGENQSTYWVEAGTSGVAWSATCQYYDHAHLIDIPEDIKLATTLQCVFLFRRRNTVGLSSMSMPDGSISIQSPLKLLNEVKEYLRPNRRTPSER